MKQDPFTIRIALDKSGTARGELYLDDGVTYEYREGNFIWRGFTAEKEKRTVRISSVDLGLSKPAEAVEGGALTTFSPNNSYAKSIEAVRVEKLVVLGLTGKPSSVKVEGGKELIWEYEAGVGSGDKKEGVASILSIKDPRVLIARDWVIVIQL